MKHHAGTLPDVNSLNIRITGMCQPGVELESWIVPAVRFDARFGFGEATWLAARPETVLAFGLAGSAVECCFGRYSGRKSSRSANLALQPKGTPVRFRAAGAVRFAQLYFSEALLDRAAAAMGVPLLSGRLRNDLVFTPDQLLHGRLAAHLSRAFDAQNAPSMLEKEARSLLVLERLVTLHAGRSLPTMRGGLAPWQLRRTIDYLTARLADHVTLAELGTLARLSPFHFARAFKMSTGLPPHRYQASLRLNRARELLARTDLPIGEVAAAVGYETPQSFARLFQRELGTTPSEYRRQAHS